MPDTRIYFQSRKYPDLFALIDEEDREVVEMYRWRVARGGRNKNFYAITLGTGGVRCIQMHRLVLGLDSNCPHVDHINGDGLDNRKSNLRLCTPSQNQANRKIRTSSASSRFKGVTWHRRLGKWQAQIKVHGKNHYLGSFSTEVDAAVAYNQAAELHFGEFSSLNELESA